MNDTRPRSTPFTHGSNETAQREPLSLRLLVIAEGLLFRLYKRVAAMEQAKRRKLRLPD